MSEQLTKAELELITEYLEIGWDAAREWEEEEELATLQDLMGKVKRMAESMEEITE